MKLDELETELKQGKIRSIYLLYGEERFLLENVVKNIKKLFGERVQGINYILLDDTNVEQLISNIETPAFGYEKKLIIAKNSGLFKKDVKKKTKNSEEIFKDRLNNYIIENIKTINEACILVFIEEAVDKCTILSTIEKYGAVCNFEYLKPFQISARLKAIANGYKVNIDNNTLNYFIECCGTDMQELINEIRKLIEFAGNGGTITNQDIDKLCIKKMESVIFDLTDSLGKKNTKGAIEILRNLVQAKEPLAKILVTLYNHFKKIYLTKIATEEGIEVASSLGLKPNQLFLVNKYKAQANLFKKSEIRIILQKLCDLDYEYKIGIIDLQMGLESILCAYI